jgi:multiple sugar transport system substrate-binding protein
MTRRMFALTLALILALGALCAVAYADEPVLIKFWGGVPAEYGPSQVVERFNEEYKDKGIQAEYVRYVNDPTGNMKLETTLLAGGEVDVYMTYSLSNLVKRGEGGMAVELSQQLAEAGFDMVAEQGALASPFVFEDGKIYGIPTKFENYFILANVEMFEAAGIELPLDGWTYDEFRETAQKLTQGEGQDKVYGMFWNSEQEIFRPSMIAQTVLGDDYYYTDGGSATNFDNEEFILLNQMIQDMMYVDGSTITHTDDVTQQLTVESTFLAGKAAMSLGVWSIRSIKDLEKFPHDFRTAYLPVPVRDPALAQYTVSDMTVGDYICMSADTKHPAEALEFMLWYTRDGMVEGTPYGRVPLNKAISNDVKLDAYMQGGEEILHADSVKKFLDIPENLPVNTITTKMAEIQKVFNEALEKIYTNNADAATALTEAKALADEFLK